ncbi:hypothetical protein SN10121_09220 [Ligilactobacillus agilis]|nr:hypothetical protein SN10121_09220 [Ligilactobacillus agilis]
MMKSVNQFKPLSKKKLNMIYGRVLGGFFWYDYKMRQRNKRW